MGSFYVTTPIYYVNDIPHIGHIYTTLVADTVARFKRMLGLDVFFLTGTDEHGQKIEKAAKSKGLSPQELADKVVQEYVNLWKELEITYDDFIRTTEERHIRAVKKLIKEIDKNGDLYISKYGGWYCVDCEYFYSDKELKDRLCPVHGKPTEWVEEENVFFRLSRYERKLLDLYYTKKFVYPEAHLNKVRSFVKAGLIDLSVSRSRISWGIPFPAHSGQVVYVWLDALTNYISALGYASDDDTLFKKFWQDDEAEKVHIIGKDILIFHAVYWPAFLLSAGINLPSTVLTHGWWLKDQKKMSKSEGNVVRPTYLVKQFGHDPLRYYLLREMVFGRDASFSDESFIDRYNAELADGLGNTFMRVVTLTRKIFSSLPPSRLLNQNFVSSVNNKINKYLEYMNKYLFHLALDEIWKIIGEINSFLMEKQPWKIKNDPSKKEELTEVLYSSLEALRVVAAALSPIMPNVSKSILDTIGYDSKVKMDAFEWGMLPLSKDVSKPKPLFPKVDKGMFFSEDRKIEKVEKKERESVEIITFDQFMKTDLRVGKIVDAENIPKSRKLIKLIVDLGDLGKRQIVAGIADSYNAEDLVGKKVIIVANLKPAKLMGVVSEGMLLAADIDGKAKIISCPEDIPEGTKVR